jgi:uncharacterized protein YbjT (DUF2867 family)
MKLIITGSLGNISRPLATLLVKGAHDVTVITSKSDKVKAIESLGAQAAVGSVQDAAFLTKTFTGADAVYTMTPPNFGVTDYRAYMGEVGKAYAEAIKSSGVKYVVNLSSVGAHLPAGTGPIAGIHDVENIMSTLPGVAIVHLRAAYFYTNLLGHIATIRQAGIIASNFGPNQRVVLIHPNDIAKKIAETIVHPFEGKSVRYVAADIRTTNEIAKVLGTAIGKPDLHWEDVSDEQILEGFLKAGFPETIAPLYVEMGAAMRSQILFEDFDNVKPDLAGIRLEDFAKEFAAVFNAGNSTSHP